MIKLKGISFRRAWFSGEPWFAQISPARSASQDADAHEETSEHATWTFIFGRGGDVGWVFHQITGGSKQLYRSVAFVVVVVVVVVVADNALVDCK